MMLEVIASVISTWNVMNKVQKTLIAAEFPFFEGFDLFL